MTQYFIQVSNNMKGSLDLMFQECRDVVIRMLQTNSKQKRIPPENQVSFGCFFVSMLLDNEGYLEHISTKQIHEEMTKVIVKNVPSIETMRRVIKKMCDNGYLLKFENDSDIKINKNGKEYKTLKMFYNFMLTSKYYNYETYNGKDKPYTDQQLEDMAERLNNGVRHLTIEETKAVITEHSVTEVNQDLSDKSKTTVETEKKYFENKDGVTVPVTEPLIVEKDSIKEAPKPVVTPKRTIKKINKVETPVEEKSEEEPVNNKPTMKKKPVSQAIKEKKSFAQQLREAKKNTVDTSYDDNDPEVEGHVGDGLKDFDISAIRRAKEQKTGRSVVSKTPTEEVDTYISNDDEVDMDELVEDAYDSMQEDDHEIETTRQELEKEIKPVEFDREIENGYTGQLDEYFSNASVEFKSIEAIYKDLKKIMSDYSDDKMLEIMKNRNCVSKDISYEAFLNLIYPKQVEEEDSEEDLYDDEDFYDE